jgi:hypothetical protein
LLGCTALTVNAAFGATGDAPALSDLAASADLAVSVFAASAGFAVSDLSEHATPPIAIAIAATTARSLGWNI